jgi:DNA-binding GntR family transcriptional regulator
MEPLLATVTRLWNSTQYYRRIYVTITGDLSHWIINAEHNLLLDALRRSDTDNARLYLRGHIRRTRVELARHPEVFEAHRYPDIEALRTNEPTRAVIEDGTSSPPPTSR